MKADVIPNPCELCKTLNCNDCRNELFIINDSTVVSLPFNTSSGIILDFRGNKTIRTGNFADKIALGDTVSKPGGYIRAVGVDRKHNYVSLKYNSEFHYWIAIVLEGQWEVDT